MSSTRIRVGLHGAGGRMGQALEELLAAAGPSGPVLAARFDRPGADGAPPPGCMDLEAGLPLCDVVVDFSQPAAAVALARRCAEAGAPALVIGTTGFSPSEERILRAAARRTAIVRSGNFSPAVNVLAALVRQAAAALPPELYDVEIFEAHHRMKVDAPSGTARMLGEAAAAGRGVELVRAEAPPRAGITGARPRGQIGFASARGGALVGEHSVSFLGEEEVLTLSHSARDRRLFARGALQAAAFAAGAAPGRLYDMEDVLGFRREGAG